MEVTTAITISGEVNLCLNGYVLQYSETKNNVVLNIAANGALNLCDCNSSKQSYKFTVDDNTGLWTLDESGNETKTKTVTGGAIINQFGSWAVKIEGSYTNSATFNMYNGNLVGNISGGVYVATYSTFTMYGGNICGNTSSGSGGGVWVNSGTFIMNGGTISGNTANSGGGGVYVRSGGFFTMNDGTIENNTSCNGFHGGGGVYVEGSFTMNGGAIRENTTSGDGGGVCVGQVNVGRFYMNNGSITENTSSSHGGGVYLGGTLYMNGGSITKNTTHTGGGNGGGVYLNSTGTFNMQGSPVILSNTKVDGVTADNVYLPSNKTITVQKAITGINNVGVTMYTKVGTFAKPSRNLRDLTSYKGFFSSDENWGIRTVKEDVYTNLELYPPYNIKTEPDDNGTIKAPETGAYDTETVTFEIIPNTNYEPATLTVTDDKDKSVLFTETEPGKYTFTMPASDVLIKATFKLIEYTVTYNLNGGTKAEGVDYTPETVKTGTDITVKAAPTKQGYRFTGWSDSNGKIYQSGDTFTMESDVTLTAQWVKQYTVTYQLDGGTGAKDVNYDPETVDTGDNITVKTAPTKDGYRFIGWSDGKTTYQPGDTITMESDTTLTAKWVAQYTVTYNLNGDTGLSGEDYTAQTVDEGTKIIVKSAPSKDGYTFTGWSDGTNTYNAGDEITVNSDITLTAQWVKQYTVTYNLNGGTGAKDVNYDPETVDTGDNITVKTAPTKDGYRFIGWSDGKTTYQPGDTITMESDTTLTAKWVAQYTVTYNLNGGTGASGEDYDPETVDTDDKITAKAAPAKDGYAFTGWLDSNGKIYQPGEKIAMNSDITLTARWKVDSIGGTTTLLKVDAKDHDTVLSGVIFELYRSDDSLVGTYTTDKNGKIYVPDLTEGTYYWREIRAAEGYLLDETKHTVTVQSDYGTSVVVENERTEVPAVFRDDHYAYIIGYGDGKVHPEANITRAEVATIFFRLLNDETRAKYLTRSNSFSDVKEGMWFNTAVSTMAAMGIVLGRPGDIFDPNANITRAEIAAIAARFDATGNTSDAYFTDIDGHWAQEEINIAANNGWVLGYEDGMFRPDKPITRAETMTMVNRVLQRIPESTEDLLNNMVTWPDNMDTSKWYYLMVQEAANSHDYKRKQNGHEYWTGLRDVPDWAAFEK